MPNPPEARPKLVLIDAMALIHRAFHAIPFLSTRNGELTNAVFGFTATVLSVLKELDPEYVAVSFDLPEPTFRHEKFAAYKATRQKAPDELRSQFGRVREVVQALEIPIFEQAGFEADDIIGSLAKQVTASKELDVYIVTGDRDSLQLVDDHIKIHMLKWRPGGRETVTYDPARLKEDTGLTPEEFVEYKALLGDTSDNIPGVPGVGEKTAKALVAEYGALEKLYEVVDSSPPTGSADPAAHPLIKPKVRENLAANREQAFLSRELSRIVIDIPLEVDLAKCVVHQFDLERATAFFGDLEFTSLIPRLREVAKLEAKTAAKVTEGAPPPKREFKHKKYQLVGTEAELTAFIKELAGQEIFAFDTETEDIEPIVPNLVGVSFSWQSHEGYYVALNHAEGPTIGMEAALAALKPILEDPNVHKVAHNLKYDYEALRCYDIVLKGAAFDTLLGSYLLNPGARTLKLDNLAHQELGYEMQPISELIGKGKDERSLRDVSSVDVCAYAAEDADVTWQLYQKLSQNLTDTGLQTMLEDIELPLVPVLAAMEQRGVMLDIPFLQKMGEEFGTQLKGLETRICQLAGREFNLNSPSQLATVLYEDLGLGDGSPGRAGKHKTTAAGQLELLKDSHEIIPEIIRYRELSKLKTTYIDALPHLVREDTKRLHTTYNQTVAATGRLSSSDPNLQNIPIRTALGREIRKAFVTAPGCVLVSADYSQFELRIAAHISGDAQLRKNFREGLDIHTATAAEVAGVTLAEVKPEMRYAAKAVNFSILYGATAHGVSRSTGMSAKDAAAYIERYFQTYPRLREYMDAMIAKAQTDGYVETLFGRRRYLPEIHASVFPVREAAKRMAYNMPIQGTQADILKLAMLKIHDELPGISPEARLILTVHDELVVEAPEEDAVAVTKFLTATMEHAYELDVPIVAEAKVGRNWGEMTPVTP